MRKRYKKLTYADRKEIEQMIGQGISPKAIALKVNVHISTVYNEIRRGMDTDGHYKAEIAQQALFSQGGLK